MIASIVFPLISLSVSPVPAPSPVPRPLATYRGGEVTEDEYREFLLAKGLEHAPDRRPGVLESIALGETLERSAMDAGLDRDPLVRFRVAEAEDDVLFALLQQRTDAGARVSDAEVEAELEKEQGERAKPRRVRLRNLFKKVPASATAAERAAIRVKMEGLRARLAAGEDFDALAYRESDSQTRFQGGLIGYVPPGILQPAVEKVAFALKDGELSPVIETPDGFVVLRCEGIQEARVMPLEEARQRIRTGLRNRLVDLRSQQLRDELIAEAVPSYRLEQALAEGKDDSVAATFRDGQVTLAELRWLASNVSVDLTRVDVPTLRSHLERHVIRTSAARRARREGLDSEPRGRARLRWARAEVLATAEMTRRVRQRLEAPTEAEMRAEFLAHPERYVQPVEVDLAVIQIVSEPQAIRRQLADAERLQARLASGEADFAESARALSRHPSAAASGRLGWHQALDLASMGPNVLRALADLEPGQLSRVIQQDDDLWIVRLWGRRPARPLTYEEAVPRLEKEVGSRRVTDLQAQLDREARHDLELHVP